jgi:hypothetical protein
LQDAYANENSKVGSWKLIGYIAPGEVEASSEGAYESATSAFNYFESFSEGGTAAAWGADNIGKLNECGVGTATDAAKSHWSVAATPAGESDDAASVGEVKYEATVATDCKALTPSFTKIGNTSAQAPNI